MNAITFDTHEFIKTLEEGGASPELAEAVSKAFKNAQHQSDLATKADLREMEVRIMGEMKLSRWMLVLIVAATVVPLLAKLFA